MFAASGNLAATRTPARKRSAEPGESISSSVTLITGCCVYTGTWPSVTRFTISRGTSCRVPYSQRGKETPLREGYASETIDVPEKVRGEASATWQIAPHVGEHAVIFDIDGVLIVTTVRRAR